MPEESNLDAKPPVESSPTPDAKPPVEAPSTSTVDAKDEGKPFEELALAAVQAKQEAETPKSTPAESSPAEQAPKEEPSKGDVLNPNKTEEEKPKGEFDDLPFHKHERFQKIVEERKTFKEGLEQVKPQLERLKTIDEFCAGNRIDARQFKDGIEIMALLNTNPAEAWKRLQPIIEHLQKFQGTVLPKDLQEAVEAGHVTLEYAQRIAAAENQKKFVEQSTQQRELHTRNEVLFNTLSSYEKQLFQTDPDYGRKQQLVIDRFVSMSAKEPWSTPDQALALVKKAYEDVNNSINSFVPKPKPTKTLTTNGASPSKVSEPKDWDHVEDHIVAQFTR